MKSSSLRHAVVAVTVALAAAFASLVVAVPAQAAFGVTEFDTDTHTPWDGTNPVRHVSQAGAHADSTVSIRFATKVAPNGDVIPDGALKDVVVDLPAGFAGNPQAVPQCDPAAFTNLLAGSCPADTQVGIAHIEIFDEFSADRRPMVWTTPIYNLVPSKGETAAFGFYVVMVPVRMIASVRTDGDYGLRVTVSNISTSANVYGQSITLWGVPADPVHDHERYARGQLESPGAPSTSKPRPFLTLPAACPGPISTGLRVRAWGESRWLEYEDVADDPETGDRSGPKGCDKLRFDASLAFQPRHTKAGSPAGYTATLSAAFNDDANELGNAHVKDVSVTLPEGVAISPASADGLDGCAPEQLKLGSVEDAACPDASKIGDVEIDTPLLRDPLVGDVYLRKPTSERLFAIALVARGSGLVIKLPGEIDTDPVTGQITTTFRNNPQLSFERLTLRFKGGSRAPLTTPPTCGTYTTTTTITSWAGHSKTSFDSFTIDRGPDGGPCRPLGFEPSFQAGTMDPSAGASSTFSLTFGRADGDQDLRDITVQLPEGLTGKLALVEQCPDHLANVGGCGEASRVGSVTVGSGAGANPFFLPGRVYLTGAYKGAPLGLAIVVPAIAGPFDLGTVVVRAAVHVDPRTAALRVVSDPMPSILEGVPLRVRTVNVRMDREGFMLNPTSCRAKQIDGVISSYGGATASRSSRFAAANCRRLAVRPRLTLSVGDRQHTRRGSTVPFTATLTVPAGNGNLRHVGVKLPKYLSSRREVVDVRVSCTIEQYEAEQCPMQVGTATAVTPLLREPLEGKAFLVRHPARRLPDLMVKLKGQGDARGIEIDLTGRIIIGRDLRLQNVFDTVPDVPVRSFQLRLFSGRNAPLATNRPLCAAATRRQPANVVFRGHNGTSLQRKQTLAVRGCSRTASRSRASKRAAKRAKARGSVATVRVVR